MREDSSRRLSWRTEAIAALDLAAKGRGRPADIEAIASALTYQAVGAVEGDPVWAFGELLEALAKAIPWNTAIRDADSRQETYPRAARARASAALAARQPGQWWPPKLVEAAQLLRELCSPDDVPRCAALLADVPLPVRVTGATLPDLGHISRYVPPPREVVEPIAVQLEVGGKPIESPFGLRPHVIYSVDLRVRVEKWHPGAVGLRVGFATELPASVAEFREVDLLPGADSARTTFQIRGAIEPLGTVFEVHVFASYVMAEGKDVPARVVGHPKFLVTTFDPAQDHTPDRPLLAAKLDAMIGDLDARIPHLPRGDREDFIKFYRSVCRFAYRIVDDREFSSHVRISEAEFQKELKKHLQADRDVGMRLEEKTRVAGGFVDLMLGDVNCELKVEHARAVVLADADQYLSQPAHYSAARGCPVSILCILDDSPKRRPPAEPTNLMEWLAPTVHGDAGAAVPSMVAVVIVPVGFGEPHERQKKGS